jgi:hypothetical protein
MSGTETIGTRSCFRCCCPPAQAVGAAKAGSRTRRSRPSSGITLKLATTRISAYHWGNPGEKVRKKITNAVPQLKALADSTLLTLLVLHDPIRFWSELLDGDAVRAAMYGIETILVSPEPAPEGGATVLDPWYGGRKKLTEDHNTSLNAISILLSEDQQLQLEVFHNWYAAVPLSPSALRVKSVTHFHLSTSPSEGFPKWTACT